MVYEFKLNGVVISREDLVQLCLEEDQVIELFETGSVEGDGLTSDTSGDVVSIEVATLIKDAKVKVHQRVAITKKTLMLSLFCTMSVLDEDSPDGIPSEYHDLFKKLGNQLIDMDLTYEVILDELIGLLGELVWVRS